MPDARDEIAVDSARSYRIERVSRWDDVARRLDHWSGWGGGYHRRLTEIYRFLVPRGQRVLEIGCARGDLLAATEPSMGVGIDFSPEMIARARQRHPQHQYLLADAHELRSLEGPFDFILLSDLVNDLWDIQAAFCEIARLCHPRTRIIINTHSRLWELPLAIAQRLNLAKPRLSQNWVTTEDTINLLQLADFEVIRRWPEILWPLPGPVVSRFFNRFLVRLWPFGIFAMTNFILARPPRSTEREEPLPRVSVVVPARNEAGNIPQIFARVPEMGAGTELIFVEGHSRDDTYGVIEREIAAHPERRCQLHRQQGTGKGDAVRLGFVKATGDVLMILDADLTVRPEDLPQFYEALRAGHREFINGVRLVYPMEEEAMRFLNLVANKFFSLAFSWLLGQPIKDTLCGTKALRRDDYERIAAARSYFGDFDPFGDFDLIFGAAKLGLRLVDLPVRYQARTYGTTNIQRWKHGWLLLRMMVFAAGRIKFV